MTLRSLFLQLVTTVVVLSQEVVYTTNSSKHVFTEMDGKRYEATLNVVISSTEVKRKCLYQQTVVDADLHIMYNEKDSRPGIMVNICPFEDTDGGEGLVTAPVLKGKPSVSQHLPSNLDQSLNIAMCIPALFYSKNKNSDNSKNWEHTWLWAEKFVNYYHKLGVGTFFLYTVGPRGVLNTNVPHIWVDVSWVPDVDKGRKKKKGMWYYGQYWTVNDCLYRNKALGTDWVVFQDYDEIFASSKYKNFAKMVQAVGNQIAVPHGDSEGAEANVLPDTIMFGNYIGNLRPCSSLNDFKGEDWTTCDRFQRSDMPECKGKLDPYMCTSWKGRRKHVDRVSTVYLTKVHKVLACMDKSCSEMNLDAREVWLDHYRGQPYNSSTLHCLCKE